MQIPHAAVNVERRLRLPDVTLILDSPTSAQPPNAEVKEHIILPNPKPKHSVFK